MKSFMPKKADLHKNFVQVDASGLVLGRMCARIAHVLRGKHRPTFTPGFDCGDHVIVLNAAKIKVTGDKLDRKILYKHTGYIGNMKELTLRQRMEKDPSEVIRTAVKRMLPRGPLGRKQLRMLHVSNDQEHGLTGVKAVDISEFGGVR